IDRRAGDIALPVIGGQHVDAVGDHAQRGFLGVLVHRHPLDCVWRIGIRRRTTSLRREAGKTLTRLAPAEPALGTLSRIAGEGRDPSRQRRVRVGYFRPLAFRPSSSAAKDWLGAGISQRKPFSTSVSTLFESTCGWPQGTPASLQIASASSIAAATSGCSYCRG